jgi:hypothetical protein
MPNLPDPNHQSKAAFGRDRLQSPRRVSKMTYHPVASHLASLPLSLYLVGSFYR